MQSSNGRTRTAKSPPTSDETELKYVQWLQDMGDAMRSRTSDNALVARELIARIRLTRASMMNVEPEGAVCPDGRLRGYVLDSVRHPAEVELLRAIYGNAFVLVGVVCDEEQRQGRLVTKYRGAGIRDAQEFMKRDAKASQKYGQRVADAFHLADFFLDNTATPTLKSGGPNPNWTLIEELVRLKKLLTHSEVVRPIASETAMHAAHSAALRSACLSRQVGAALARKDGVILATGANEVPKYGGGVYTSGIDDGVADQRCAYGNRYCSNTKQQLELIGEVAARIAQVVPGSDAVQIRAILDDSRIRDLLEFSRAVHAEMAAILEAGRVGASTLGAIAYVTTFPCHYCARHLVCAGIHEVQYIEPYPKSLALSLHSDSITSDRAEAKELNKVLFRPFSGVAPRMFVRAFVKDRELKDKQTGMLSIHKPEWASAWHVGRVSYAELENELAHGG